MREPSRCDHKSSGKANGGGGSGGGRQPPPGAGRIYIFLIPPDGLPHQTDFPTRRSCMRGEIAWGSVGASCSSLLRLVAARLPTGRLVSRLLSVFFFSLSLLTVSTWARGGASCSSLLRRVAARLPTGRLVSSPPDREARLEVTDFDVCQNQ